MRAIPIPRSCRASVATSDSITSLPLPDAGVLRPHVEVRRLWLGAWSEATAWMRPARRCSHSWSTEARSRLGGFHFWRVSAAMSSSDAHR